MHPDNIRNQMGVRGSSARPGRYLAALLTTYCCFHLVAVTAALDGVREGSCPPLQQLNVCSSGRAAQAQPCAEDADCARAADKCCPSACGTTCVKPLYTGCELVRRETERRARALPAALAANVTVPHCASTGAFERVQCSQSYCWCVDQSGSELPGTRASARHLVDCDGRSRCNRPTCRMLCPSGFALDSDGCARCSCRDPCEGVTCAGGAVCSSAPSKCRDPPCPALATCKAPRSLYRACPNGQPLAVQGSQRPFLCGTGPGRPTCPPLFQCSVQPRHEYGVCCPVGRLVSKPGECPSPRDSAPSADDDESCREECDVDLECPHMEKCCHSAACGKQCVQPKNITECFVARALSELLASSEREGRGYAPQCDQDGAFSPRQCSRNGLVCWCVDPMTGNKARGSMGSAATVRCPSPTASGRSMSTTSQDCDRQLCAQLCQYGFTTGTDGCPTCECADPCAGFACPRGEHCVAHGDDDCQGTLCAVTPHCEAEHQDKAGSVDPDDMKAESVDPVQTAETMNPTQEAESAVETKEVADEDATMCQYLRDFDATMEGTRSDMKLALAPPSCTAEGAYEPRQCAGADCWCVDVFGTEIPQTRGNASDCAGLRTSLACSEPQCRLACEYGFVLDPATRCATCACRDACDAVSCATGSACVAVDVSCPRGFCAPVPVCLPVKEGQCPYLLPGADGSCEFECGADAACPGADKCCPNGCGTSCAAPLRLTACQHRRAEMKQSAADQGIRGRHVALPRCADDGSFERVQCSANGDACWCVDESGTELGGTRRSHGQSPDCDAPAQCPQRNCPPTAICPHGFARDEAGCETCTCEDACAGKKCPPATHCRLAAVACVGNAPCPPMPVCMPAPDERCQGQPPLTTNGSLVRCGPGSHDQCPSSHRCLLSPLGEPPVCCPKPRSVCTEPAEPQDCTGPTDTRFRFNATSNRCEPVRFCGGAAQNMFVTEPECRAVCPVLTQCERVRERNAARPSTLAPACDPLTGAWAPVQCLPAAGVCWCVSPAGRPVKGSVTRDVPRCSFRTARRRSDDDSQQQDLDVLERLLGQLTQWEQPELESRADLLEGAVPVEAVSSGVVPGPRQSRCLAMRGKMLAAAATGGGGGGGGYIVACDSEGRFTPVQCYQHRPECWCVDEAGNQLPDSTTFLRGATICLPTPIEAVEVRLGFSARAPLRPSGARELGVQVRALLARLRARLRDDAVAVHPASAASEGLVVEFALVGGNKVDVAYQLEEMVISESMTLPVSSWGDSLTADVTASRFTHRLADAARAASVIARDQREVVMETVPAASRYQAAILVLSVASATVILVLVLLVMLYRRKVAQANSCDQRKLSALDQRFVDSSAPVYVVSLPGPNPARPSNGQPVGDPGLRL